MSLSGEGGGVIAIVAYNECSLWFRERTVSCVYNLCPIPLCFDIIEYV